MEKRQKRTRDNFRIPRRVQDTIPIRRIWEDGIFLIGDAYTKTFKFTDINYRVASEEDKESMYRKYREFLNSFDSNASYKISVNNRRLDRKAFEENILLPLKHDKLDEYREEYNAVLMKKADGDSGIIQEKYVTVSAYKRDIKEAKSYFKRMESDLSIKLAALGSKCTGLNAVERLKILHDFYRPGHETHFNFDVSKAARLGHDFRDYICPDSMEVQNDYLKVGETYVRVLFLRELAAFMDDEYISNLLEFNPNMMLSIDVQPLSITEAMRKVESKILGIETNITNWQRRQNANNNFSAIIPYDMEQQRIETREFLNDLAARDQRMMMTLLTMVICADTKEELNSLTESLCSQKGMSQVAVLKFQQLDGLNTVLPYGPKLIKAERTLTTESLAILTPFKAQEIQETGGIYFGENAVSKNLILCNLSNLLNQAMIVLGVPGSGKSFFAKLLIIVLALSTDEHIMICDPEGEYSALIEALGGEVIHISAGCKDRINPMDMDEDYGGNNPIVEKAQFIMSLVDELDDKHSMTAHHKSIIDRCVAAVYKEQQLTGKLPTLRALREKIKEQPEREAKDLVLTLELFTTGSQDYFAHETNVDTKNRLISFDIHDVSENLKSAALVTITETMVNRVTANWRKGIKTHVFIDEYHVVYANKYSAEFFNTAWRQFRKRNASPCAITQNVTFLLESPQASALLSNSEIVMMFNQSPSDRETLAQLLDISNEQMSYISDSEVGTGLMKYGPSLVPFVNKFPSNTKLYDLITTRPGEGAFARSDENE